MVGGRDDDASFYSFAAQPPLVQKRRSRALYALSFGANGSGVWEPFERVGACK